MKPPTSDIAFTPTVKAIQQRLGSHMHLANNGQGLLERYYSFRRRYDESIHLKYL